MRQYVLLVALMHMVRDACNLWMVRGVVPAADQAAVGALPVKAVFLSKQAI